jgi:DNA-binding NtrC family response regulator
MRSESVHSTTIYDRSFFLATGVVVYVTLAACQTVGFGWPAYALLAGAPLGLALVWRFTRRSLGSEVAQVEVSALGALRVAAWGAALWLGARLCPPGRPGLDLAANLGLGAACVAANLALARIPAREGLVQPPRSARSLDAAAFCALLWSVAAALAAGRLLWRGPSALLDPVATDYATNAASIAAVLELTAAALRLRSVRRLELGVLERASGAVVMCGAALAVAVPLALLDLAPPYQALPAGALVAALASAWVSALRDPTLISRALRAGSLVLALGAPLAVATAALVARLPGSAALIALVGCGLGALLGLLGRSGVWPWAPREVRRLEVLEAASRAVLRPEPNAALLAVLEALQGLQRTLLARPELWRRDPPEAWRVDVAGYLHTESGCAPEQIYELAQGEPEQLLRRDVLTELEVRRPEVREALAWMEARDAFAVSLICEEHGPIGLLMLPRGSRRSAVTLAEARAVRALCQRLSAVLGISATLARARSREEQALERAERLEQERSRLETRIVGQTRHRDSVAEVLADGVRVATYGTRARRTLRELERHAAGARDVSLEVPVGVDGLAWACAFHQTGTGRTGPLVVCDATTATTHPPAYWSHDTDAPTRRAEGGTLVILHVTALPEESQEALCAALSQRSAGGGRACVVVATLNEAPERALQQGRLLPSLGWFLVPHSLRLPPLRERAEDLRGLVLSQLLASGARHQGAPLGIEPQALALLVSHPWPGNDAELALVVQRAARVATAERVSVADLAAAGFAGMPAPAQPEPLGVAEPLPLLPRRASSVRPAVDERFSERPVPKRSERVRKPRKAAAARPEAAAADAELPATQLPESAELPLAAEPAPAEETRSPVTRRRRRR